MVYVNYANMKTDFLYPDRSNHARQYIFPSVSFFANSKD
jgi:hypothetical protein